MVCELSFVQNKNSEFCAPLTSFDWNETDPNIIGASSIDTTCTIWGLEVQGATCTVWGLEVWRLGCMHSLGTRGAVPLA